MSAVDPEGVVALIPCHRTPPASALLAEVASRVGRVLVVDDGMPAAAARALGRAVGGRVEGLHLPANRGKGHAIAAGLAHLLSGAGPPQAVHVLDADGQHPAALICRFLTAGAGAELVVGDRLGDARCMPFVRRAANHTSSALLSRVTGHPVRDGQCGMRLLRGRALREVPFPRGGYEAETVHLKRCLRAGVDVAWVPIPAVYEGAPSSFRPFRDSARVVRAALAGA